jgi:septal ring factor EnvC (AmiA/AmiB activator)
MPSKPVSSGRVSAEAAYRAAYERLRLGKPERLPEGTLVSQNNVAKEAGCDPSALKKSRFPSLIADIQRYVSEHSRELPPTRRQTQQAQRKRNRNFRNRIDEILQQRDQVASMLNEANATILELGDRIAELEAKLLATNGGLGLPHGRNEPRRL